MESIFEIDYTGDPSGAPFSRANQGSLTAQFFSPWICAPVQGWSYNAVTPDLLNAFNNEGDVIRRDATILIDNSPAGSDKLRGCGWDPIPVGHTGYLNNGGTYGNDFHYSRKYFVLPEEFADNGNNLQISPLNHKIMRYAEILLIIAEAELNGASVSTSGQSAFNQVRNRAGLGNKTLTYEALKLERRLELATEWNRFHDLLRWGDAGTVLQSNGFTIGRDELLPIPFNEIELTGKDEAGQDILSQNQGYN